MHRAADPLIGRALGGRYSLVRRVARGGMATVYEARDLRLQRSCAVKVMHTDLGDDHDFADRFVREAHAAARLSHPHVVSVMDLGEDDGLLYLVMEYVPGRTLRDVIADQAPLPPGRSLALLEPVLAALAEAHRSGLVHRDVKPENVLIADDGRIKVADFGLARAFDVAADATTTGNGSGRTSTVTGGILMGTVSYVAPELIVNQRADPRADVYAAGVVLYELLTGTKPHQGDGPLQVAWKHVNQDVPPPSAALVGAGYGVGWGIPAYVDALVVRATARDRDRRPADAKVFLHQVRRVRAALEAGVADDPELTADILPTALIAPVDGIDYVDDPDATGTRAYSPAEEATTVVPQVTSDPRPTDPPPTVPPPTGRPVTSAPRVAHVPPQPRPARASASGATAVPPREPRRRRRSFLVPMLVLLVAALAYGAWWVGFGRFTSTPALEQLSVASARARITDAGLQLDVVRRQFSETVTAGAVISTDPAAGARIPEGGTVEAVVSKGQERYAVPVLRGRSLDESRTALTTAHLTLGEVAPEWSETVRKGAVIVATPPAGSELRTGAEVNLTVSRGREPISIPDLTGTDGDEAEQQLTELGLEPSVSTEHSDTVPKGDVVRQSPDRGTGHRGDPIDLTVSSGPERVEVPDLTAMSVENATAALQDVGLEIEVQESAAYVGLDAVLNQDPEAGTSIARGSTVTVKVV